MAALFAAMAVGTRLVTGAWPFDGALELAVVCLALGGYFHLAGRRRRKVPDGAVLLDRALQLAAVGCLAEAIAQLDRAIEQNPHLWQAWQYRGELHLALEDRAAAERDFAEAIRLAPGEQHLHSLREQAKGPAGAA